MVGLNIGVFLFIYHLTDGEWNPFLSSVHLHFHIITEA